MRLEGKSVRSSIWIYKINHEVDGKIVGYKEIFVAQGFSWKEGIEYKETFASNGSFGTQQVDSCVKIKEYLV